MPENDVLRLYGKPAAVWGGQCGSSWRKGMKLTERDKKLLLILVYFVIIAGFGAFAFRPLINYYMDIGDRLVLLESQKQEMDARIAEANGLEQRRNELADLFRVSTQDFYPMLGSEEVDKEITGIVLSCGMQAVSLNIAMPEEGMVFQMYPYAEKAGKVELPGDMAGEADIMTDITADTRPDGEDMAGDGEEEENTQSYVYAPVVTLTASGSRTQAEELIDRLMRDYPAIRLRSYSRRVQNEGIQEAGAETEFLALELELYMCDKSILEQGETP